MNLLDRYHERINQQIKTVEETQYDNIVAVGNAIAECVAKGGAVHVFDTGHIIDSELIERGGGVYYLKKFKYNLDVFNDVRPRDRSSVDKDMTGLAAYALKQSEALPGDIIIIGSVSGKNQNVVDLAIEAKKFGLAVVAMTSLEYSKQVESKHSSGKRLFECADYVLDNCAPAAEGMMKVEGIDAPFAAASGISAALIMWSVVAHSVDALLAKGITPSIYKSYNFADGWEYNAIQKANYEKTGQ
jgi:uncharacterized phosphosugar-binding protein